MDTIPLLLENIMKLRPGKFPIQVLRTAGQHVQDLRNFMVSLVVKPISGLRLFMMGLHWLKLPEDPNYHFTTDMTNQAISWVRYQKALSPDKPFFMYYAPGATHAPHHVPKEWVEKYKGKFDQGWDKIRELTLERQIKLGIVPEGTKLAPKPADIKDWDNTFS